MNYPVWELTWLGGGTLLAVISILHVYVAHLAVGGGMYIWLTDVRASRRNDVELLSFLKKHTWFFLLLTMVFGAVTGVGIWFTISLVNPSGTSVLIHTFVFVWAIEWVFFLVEIVSLLVYYYRFDQLDSSTRRRIAFIYFASAWLSLFAVNGILSFMLTPGTWLETGKLLHGFFNPSFVPTTLLRTALSALFAGIFSMTTAIYGNNAALRGKLLSYSRKWLSYPALLVIPFVIWTYLSLPPGTRETAISINPQSVPMVASFLAAYLVLLLLPGHIAKTADTKRKALVPFVIAAGLFIIGGFEYLREISRKPFVIRDYMYSSSIRLSEAGMVRDGGILSRARWALPVSLDESSMAQAGREIFNLECLSCHTINGVRNDIVAKCATLTFEGLLSQLDGQGAVLDYMPPFLGTEKEKNALATYLYQKSRGGSVPASEPPITVAPKDAELIPFDQYRDQYVLLAWPEKGINTISDSDRWFLLHPPLTSINALLIKRGKNPEIITENVSISYSSGPEYAEPAERSLFWKYAGPTFGRRIKKNSGFTGNGTEGTFTYDMNSGMTASCVPVMPYTASGGYDPYPVIAVSASLQGEEKPVVATRLSAVVSAEMGCPRCHGGWKDPKKQVGISDETAINILKAHDRISKTRLYREAKTGSPRLCGSCHFTEGVRTSSDHDRLDLSASIHGFHANYIRVKDSSACMKCHPSSSGSASRASKDIHDKAGISCVECHGTLDLHALALLKEQRMKKSAHRLLRPIKERSIVPLDRIQGRRAWIQEPSCLTCHAGFNAPTAYDAFNVWNKNASDLFRNSTDSVGIPCQACHGPVHALYPSNNPYGNRDVLQPLQYSHSPYPIGSDRKCAVCHMQQMNEEVHHENMLRMFRNR